MLLLHQNIIERLSKPVVPHSIKVASKP